jgi:hypothetical protein
MADYANLREDASGEIIPERIVWGKVTEILFGQGMNARPP